MHFTELIISCFILNQELMVLENNGQICSNECLYNIQCNTEAIRLTLRIRHREWHISITSPSDKNSVSDH